MELVQVKIKGMVITSQYGTLNTGDVLRTNAAFAKHLVDDCSAAEYVDAKPQLKTEVAADASEDKPAKRKSKG